MKRICEPHIREFHQEIGRLLMSEKERKSIRRGVRKVTRVLKRPENQTLIF